MFIVACNTIPGARPDLLDFLTPGRTSRQEVITTLGQPSASFERERILTYRIGQDPKQGFYLVEPKQTAQWNSARFSLVLLFDDRGVLKEKKTVAVQ